MPGHFCTAIQKCWYFWQKYQYRSTAVKVQKYHTIFFSDYYSTNILRINTHKTKSISKTEKYRAIKFQRLSLNTLKVQCTARKYRLPTFPYM